MNIYIPLTQKVSQDFTKPLSFSLFLHAYTHMHTEIFPKEKRGYDRGHHMITHI